VSDYGLDDREIGVQYTAGAKDLFSLTSVSRPAWGPTGDHFPCANRGRGLTLTTRPICRVQWVGAIPLPQAPPWRVPGLLCDDNVEAYVISSLTSLLFFPSLSPFFIVNIVVQAKIRARHRGWTFIVKLGVLFRDRTYCLASGIQFSG
jgi:hypothetical protein